MIKRKSKANISSLIELWPFFRVYKKDIFLVVVALLLTASTVLFFGEAIKYLIDYGFVKKSRHFLNIILIAVVAATLLMAVAGYYRSSLISTVSEKAIADLRKKTYQHIIKISAEFFEITKTGDVVSRLTVDTVLLYNIISTNVSFLLRNILLFVGGIFFLIFTSVKLTAISLVLIALAISPIFIMGRKIKALSVNSQESLALVGAHIEETMNGVKTIQSYLCEDKEIKNFANLVDDSLAIAIKKITLRSLLVALVIGFAFSGIAVVLWVGGYDVLSGKMTSGDLSSFIFYSVVTATSLVALSQIFGQLQAAAAACERVIELLKIESPVKEAKNLQKLSPQKNYEISFKNVDFSYPSRKDLKALKDFSLDIKSGQKIAIVGPSGAGKSTILQLLLRFYDVDDGAILLNEVDIRLLSFANLRQNFSYISQDCFIFSGTVFENIAYVNKSVSESDVEKIITRNPALHFINKLPQKMHSFVGEKGIKLSGGERQRIALARAIVKDAPVLLLDEATSALDNQNQQNMARAIADLSRDKIVITIAHKLSTVSSSDFIIFIKDGEVVESGSHGELMMKDGFYKKMYEAESLGLI